MTVAPLTPQPSDQFRSTVYRYPIQQMRNINRIILAIAVQRDDPR